MEKMEKVLGEVLRYKPVDPMEFVAISFEYESCPRLLAFYKLQLSRNDPELFLEEVSRTYRVFGRKFEGLEILTRAFACDMPEKYKVAMAEAVSEYENHQYIDFTRFCACVRVLASCYGIYRDALVLWRALGSTNDSILKSDLLEPLPSSEAREGFFEPLRLELAILEFEDHTHLSFTQVVDSVLLNASGHLRSLHKQLSLNFKHNDDFASLLHYDSLPDDDKDSSS